NLAVDRNVLIPLLNDKEKFDFEIQEEQGFTTNQVIFYNYLIKVRSSDEFKKIKEDEAELEKRYLDFMDSIFKKYAN
ncbi:hypothetical protein, partial [Peptoniphilus timonensis]|uniref:hypothetical protein n=1 Tax=Peptoniphilus timonensis TaxID=1268254 RepID=UPI000590B551